MQACYHCAVMSKSYVRIMLMHYYNAIGVPMCSCCIQRACYVALLQCYEHNYALLQWHEHADVSYAF